VWRLEGLGCLPSPLLVGGWAPPLDYATGSMIALQKLAEKQIY